MLSLNLERRGFGFETFVLVGKSWTELASATSVSPLKSPRGSPTKNGLPAYSAFSIVLAVSERSLSRLSNPSPNNCFPESGKSSYSKDESCGLSLAS